MPVATKKHRSNPAWIHRHVTDPYVIASKRDGYRARSAYKLIELDEKERLFAPGRSVVDLGSAPGSWSQVAAQRLAGRGFIAALDILPMEPVEGVSFLQGDFREQSVCDALSAALGGRRPDVVLSDMAPNLSGIAAVDAARSMDLCELARDFALEHLADDGVFVTKCFQGSGYSQFVQSLKLAFRTVACRKPQASRDTSAEVYLVARGRKAARR